MSQEAAQGKINLPEDEPAIVALLFQYIYEAEYDPPLSDAPVTSHLEVIQTQLNNARRGEKYSYEFPHTCHHNWSNDENCSHSSVCPHHVCIHVCGSTCRDFICTKCTRRIMKGNPEHLSIHAKMYEIADKYDVLGLKDLAKEKFKLACAASWNDDAFSIAAHHAFSTTMEDDKGLRDIVSGTISDHMELIRKPEVQALMTEFNGLSLGILMKKADEHGWGVK